MTQAQSFLDKFASELNPTQAEAVRTTEGPLLILAGAGSGKTRVLTYRMAYLVAMGQASPDELLAVTFTNKAAREMRERTQSLLTRIGVSASLDSLWISTFHSSCVRILRAYGTLLGYEPGFVIYDDSDQLSLLKKICDNLNINDKIYPAKTFQYSINQSKNEYVRADQFKGRRGHFMDEKVGAVYEAYEREMRKNNALDFGDLLTKTVELFEKNPQVLDFYQERFKFIHIDEYQDTNHVQYLLVKLLAGKYKNLCVVGDEDQSIYSWRGADIKNILSFETDLPDAKVVKLEENYRSTKNIVEAASHVIKKNTERKDKTLWTANGDGDLIRVHEEMTEYDEARSVVREIQASAHDDMRPWSEFAVFYRTNAQSRVVEDQLRGAQIPYRILGGMRFYDRAEIKDVISYMKLIMNPADSISLKRIINVPARGIGKTTVEKLETYADSQNLSLFAAILPALQAKVLDRGATTKVLGFYEILHKLISEQKSSSPLEAYHAVLDATQYVNRLREDQNPESAARIDNLEELDAAIGEFEKERGDEAKLETFLEEMALLTDADRNKNDPNVVTLMTLHLSKGLEFPIVFIVGLEEGLFPSVRGSDDAADESKIEEERRLFYVGMTRARQKLFLSLARMRRVWGADQMYPPSRFLEEIPEKYLQRSSRMKKPTVGLPAATWRRKSLEGVHADDDFSTSAMPDYEDDFDTDSSSSDGFKKGMRVRHPSYGVGTIHTIEGSGDDQKVSILFPDKSLKKFVVKYARLQRA